MLDETNEVVSLLKEIRDLLKSQPSSGGGNPSGNHHERTQKEDGTWVWVIPTDQKPSKNPCKYCKGDIYWCKSKKGKNVPVNKDGTFHGDTCTKEYDAPKPLEISSGDVPF